MFVGYLLWFYVSLIMEHDVNKRARTETGREREDVDVEMQNVNTTAVTYNQPNLSIGMEDLNALIAGDVEHFRMSVDGSEASSCSSPRAGDHGKLEDAFMTPATAAERGRSTELGKALRRRKTRSSSQGAKRSISSNGSVLRHHSTGSVKSDFMGHATGSVRQGVSSGSGKKSSRTELSFDFVQSNEGFDMDVDEDGDSVDVKFVRAEKKARSEEPVPDDFGLGAEDPVGVGLHPPLLHGASSAAAPPAPWTPTPPSVPAAALFVPQDAISDLHAQFAPAQFPLAFGPVPPLQMQAGHVWDHNIQSWVPSHGVIQAVDPALRNAAYQYSGEPPEPIAPEPVIHVYLANPIVLGDPVADYLKH